MNLTQHRVGNIINNFIDNASGVIEELEKGEKKRNDILASWMKKVVIDNFVKELGEPAQIISIL